MGSFLDFLFIKKIDPNRMHPNPEDEFSMPEIGPNKSIIESYCQKIRFNQLHDFLIFEEPIVLRKLPDGDFMLLNGHHRWAACIKMNVKKVRAVIIK